MRSMRRRGSTFHRQVLLVAVLGIAAAVVPAGISSATTGTTWAVRDSVGGTQALWAVSCANSMTCVAAGVGTASTTDGGLHWHRHTLVPAVGYVDALSCPTVTYCLAIGGYFYPTQDSVVVFTSSNLGASWKSVASIQEGTGFVTASCASASLCLSTYQSNAFGVSTDGGATWTYPSLPSPAPGDVVATTSVSCPSASRCFVAGTATNPHTSSASLVVWRRVGTSFVRVFTHTGNGSAALINCTASGTCGVTEATRAPNSYFSTTNGGTTWTVHATPTPATGVQSLSCAAHTCTLLSIHNASSPLLASATSNGGTTWVTSSIYAHPGLASGIPPAVACPTSSSCFAVDYGPLGVVARQQSGSTWRASNVAVGPVPLAVAACYAPICVALGGSVVIRSTNNGLSWTPSSSGVATGVSLRGAACTATSPVSCIAVGSVGATGAVYRSGDAGATWHAVSIPAGMHGLNRVACTAPSFCVASGGTGSLGVLISTNDGGTWSLRSFPSGWGSPTIQSLTCAGTACLAAGGATGGAFDISIPSVGSWSLTSFSTFTGPVSVYCETSSDCWALGTYIDTGPGGKYAGVYKSTTGGLSWTLVSEGTVEQPGLVACEGSTCHLVGTGGLRLPTVDAFYSSADGGVTWSADHTPASEIQVSSMLLSSGRWIAVGASALNGPEVVTSP